MWRPWIDHQEVIDDTHAESCDRTDRKDETERSERRRLLSTDAKEIVRHVYQVLRQRDYGKQEAIEVTSVLTNVPKTTVWYIARKPIRQRKKRKDKSISRCFDSGQEELIRRMIDTMWEEKCSPTLDNLHKRLISNEADVKCSRSSLWRFLHRKGFEYGTSGKKSLEQAS